MKTILVTGASGFIGGKLVERLRRHDDARVLALARSIDPESGPDALQTALEDLQPSFWSARQIDAIDVVFHLGAYIPKNRAQVDAAKPIVASNILGIAALLESIPGVPRHFVFASSVDVYGREVGRAIDEASTVAPATLYGASKVFGEHLVRSYADRTGCRYSILRLGHVFGPGEDRFEKVIPNLIRAMLGGLEPQLSGDGSTARDFLYVDDAVGAFVAASQRSLSADLVNVVRGESVAIVDVAKWIAEIIGYRGPFHFSGANGDSLRFSNVGMKRLGIDSFTPTKDGLAREIAYFKALDLVDGAAHGLPRSRWNYSAVQVALLCVLR